MNRPVLGVLALQGDVREHVAALTEVGAEARPVRRPHDLAGLAGVVLPGGESTVIDKLTRIFGLRTPLIAALQAGMPAFGSCAGMVLLADQLLDAPPDQETFGGIDMAVRRNAFGRQVDSAETGLALSCLEGDPFPAVFIRAPWVEKTGDDVELLGAVSDADGAERVVAVRQGTKLATAFHPELTGDRRLHRYFLELVRTS